MEEYVCSFLEINYRKNKVTKSELELKLKELISDEVKTNYLTLVEEVIERTKNKEDLETIIKIINKKLNSKKWKRILKTLNLILVLIRGCSIEYINNLKFEKKRLEVLANFYYEVNGAADSKSFYKYYLNLVREKSENLLVFLNDETRLKEERENYSKTKKFNFVNEKRYSGGLLNTIGSFNPENKFDDKTFGLGKSAAGFGLGSSKNINNFSKKINSETNNGDSDSSSSEEEVRNANPTETCQNMMNFDDIFEINKNKVSNSSSVQTNLTLKNIDLLSMNDLFSASNNSTYTESHGINQTHNLNDINDIFDFTKK